MARTDERKPDDGIRDGRLGLEQPPERLGGGGRRSPVVVGVVMALVVVIAVWQPWAPSVLPSVAPSPQQAAVATAGASAAPLASPSLPIGGDRRATPAPSIPGGMAGTAVYTTVTDNEWTVVALLAPSSPTSTDEPATQHPTLPWSADGPFLVLQQGLTPVEAPMLGTSSSAGPCPPAAVPRDRTAVPLPAGRVAYLGITVPSGVPRPQVTAERLGGSGGALGRAPAPAIRLAGMDASTRYVIPAAGPGAAVLFSAVSGAAMAPGAYQFTVASPGATGQRYLYACIGP